MRSLSILYDNPTPEDSTEEDSAEYSDIISDTLIYSDGADTIYELYDSLAYTDTSGTDTSIIYGRMMVNRHATYEIESINYSAARDPFNSGPIEIYFGGNSKTINRGLYGINLEQFFKPSSFPNDGTSVYSWQRLIDLGPEVLRFPSGASTKFMHLRPFVQICNLEGQIMLEKLYVEGEVINIYEILAGYYVVNVKDNTNRVYHKPLIKIK